MAGGLPLITGGRRLAWRLLWFVTLACALAFQAGALLRPSEGVATVALEAAQGAVLIAVAALLFRRRPADPVAAMLSLAFLLWAVTSAADPGDRAATVAWVEALDRLRFLLLVAAVLLFPSGRFEPRWTAPVLAASCLVFLVGIGAAVGLLPQPWFLPPAALCVAASILSLGIRLRRAPPCRERQQLKWVAFGLAVGLVLILVHRIGAALGPSEAWTVLLLETSFRCGVMAMALGFLVSILRYRLYDAEAAISRSAAYLALTLTLVAIFAASETTIELVGQRFLGNRIGDLAGGIAAALAAVLVAPLHQRMSHWAEQRFQRDLVVLREELPDLLAEAREHAGVECLAAMLLPRLEAGLRSAHIALVLDGAVVAVNDIPESTARSWLRGRQLASHQGPLMADRQDPLFPLRVPLTAPDRGSFGWVLLGPRPDGSFYRQDELEALVEIAGPLRRTIFSVRDRERRSEEWASLKDRLVKTLADLAERVAVLERAAPPGARNMTVLHRTHSKPEV